MNDKLNQIKSLVEMMRIHQFPPEEQNRILRLNYENIDETDSWISIDPTDNNSKSPIVFLKQLASYTRKGYKIQLGKKNIEPDSFEEFFSSSEFKKSEKYSTNLWNFFYQYPEKLAEAARKDFKQLCLFLENFNTSYPKIVRGTFEKLAALKEDKIIDKIFFHSYAAGYGKDKTPFLYNQLDYFTEQSDVLKRYMRKLINLPHPQKYTDTIGQLIQLNATLSLRQSDILFSKNNFVPMTENMFVAYLEHHQKNNNLLSMYKITDRLHAFSMLEQQVSTLSKSDKLSIHWNELLLKEINDIHSTDTKLSVHYIEHQNSIANILKKYVSKYQLKISDFTETLLGLSGSKQAKLSFAHNAENLFLSSEEIKKLSEINQTFFNKEQHKGLYFVYKNAKMFDLITPEMFYFAASKNPEEIEFMKSHLEKEKYTQILEKATKKCPENSKVRVFFEKALMNEQYTNTQTNKIKTL